MSDNIEKANVLFYVIPSIVMHDDSLSYAERILYGEIVALCNKKGYCWATNNHLAKLFNTTPKTISVWINHLKEKGYLTTEMHVREDNLGSERHIRVPLMTYGTKEYIPEDTQGGIPKNVKGGIPENVEGGIPENVIHNNITNNNITIEKEIYKEKEPAKKTKRTVSDDIESNFLKLWDLYPRKEGKSSVSKKSKKAIYDVGYDKMVHAINSYKRKIVGQERKFIQMGSTFFNSGYVDYIDGIRFDDPVNDLIKLKDVDGGFDKTIACYPNKDNYDLAKRIWINKIAQKETLEEQKAYAYDILLAVKLYVKQNSENNRFKTFDKWLNDCLEGMLKQLSTE